MTQYFTVTELAFSGQAYRRQRNSKRPDKVCLLLDMRGQREASIQVWSFALGKVRHLPRSLVKIETDSAQRFAAITMPRWLATREHLYTQPPIPVRTRTFNGEQAEGFTDAQRRDDGEWEIAQYVVSQEMRHTCLPGQRLHVGGGDVDGGRMRRT